MPKKKTFEQVIKEKVDKNYEWMLRHYKDGRDLSAILGSCGFIYNDEFEIAKKYFLERVCD